MSATARAPGKIILFGEHAVVYGRPAIAVPLEQVQATAEVSPLQDDFQIAAADLNNTYALQGTPLDDPLAAAVRLVLDELGKPAPNAILTIRSTIPIASGLGSGAAVSVAIIQAVSSYLNTPLPLERVSALAFQVEKLHHGTPSGIDNTVVTYRQPVYYVRDQTIKTFQVHSPFQLLVADTGVSSPTRVAVGDVRAAWQADPDRYSAIFDRIASIVNAARSAIETGRIERLGPLMSQNQTLLRELGVSSPEIERLVNAALEAGAWGCKLSGAGRGGNVIALVDPNLLEDTARALLRAGAVKVISNRIT